MLIVFRTKDTGELLPASFGDTSPRRSLLFVFYREGFMMKESSCEEISESSSRTLTLRFVVALIFLVLDPKGKRSVLKFSFYKPNYAVASYRPLKVGSF
jgi:hypothetical protein